MTLMSNPYCPSCGCDLRAGGTACWNYDCQAYRPGRASERALATATSRTEKAERERDEARSVVIGLVAAMVSWGAEEDGVPEDGPIGAAFDRGREFLDALDKETK